MVSKLSFYTYTFIIYRKMPYGYGYIELWESGFSANDNRKHKNGS